MIQDVKDLKSLLDEASLKLRKSLRSSGKTGEWAIKSARADAYEIISKKLESIIKKEQDAITKTKA